MVGLGYVGLSNAVLLAQHNEVIGVDISKDRVNCVNARKSPIMDAELSKYLAETDLNFSASTDLESSISSADYVIVSTPTNYDEKTGFFDTSSVESVISVVTSHAPDACIVIKSTIPIGFIAEMKRRNKFDAIMFSPEFLREGRALYDNLYPSRIIVGERSERAESFANILAEGCLKDNVNIQLMNSREAEAVKLFSNTYLAMRVAFFNELDSYALSKNLDAKKIIEGISADSRIGAYYNNPSFGYGGYCLPKDTKQLLANYKGIPQDLVSAIVTSNSTRKAFIANEILKKKPTVVGVYRLIMKSDSDNFRESAIQEIMDLLKNSGCRVIVYEPELQSDEFRDFELANNLVYFKEQSDIIICNRFAPELSNVKNKVFTRDIFGND